MVKEKDDSAKTEKLPKKTDKKPLVANTDEPKSSKKANPKVAKKEKAEPKAAAKDSDKAAAKSASKPAALSATSLIFQAPDLPPVEPRKKSSSKKSSEAESESHLRRRSRRRAGEPIDESSDLPNVVVKVRTPRAPKEPSNEPQRVKGSTRLEAKKQRRRDGRDSGRRRQTITETEFLARRESVDRMMLVRSKDAKIQLCVVEDNVLVEHYVAQSQDGSLIGNVYLGKVQNVLPSMEAAFVDIGKGRNAVL
jgi:ribonuclease E